MVPRLVAKNTAQSREAEHTWINWPLLQLLHIQTPLLFHPVSGLHRSWICQFRLRRGFCWVRYPCWFFRNGNPDHTRVRRYSKCSLRLLSFAARCSYHPRSGQTIAVSSPSVLAFPCWATFSLFLRVVNSMAWTAKAQPPENRKSKKSIDLFPTRYRRLRSGSYRLYCSLPAGFLRDLLDGFCRYVRRDSGRCKMVGCHISPALFFTQANVLDLGIAPDMKPLVSVYSVIIL